MIEHYVDPDRAQYLAEIEVVNRNCEHLLIPPVFNSDVEFVSHPGTQRFVIYEDCVKQVEAMAETEPELIEEAKKIFNKKLKAMMIREELIKDTDDILKIDYEKPEIKQFMSGLTMSVESVFRDIHQRDIKPLISCKVIKAGIEPVFRADPLAKFRKKEPLMDPQTLAQIIAEATKIVEQSRSQNANQQRR